jgi:predicted enzyme related to lactoylglutathione lyase
MFVAGLCVGGNFVGATESQSRPGTTETQLVTGIGGVFFKAADPAKLRGWYREHLGIDGGEHGIAFFWREEQDAKQFGRTVWSVFPKETNYFGAAEQDFMVNYRVRDLDRLLVKLRAEGVRQVGPVEEYWYGRFAWVIDGEGNRVELWQPVNQSREEFESRMKRERVP